MNTTSECGNPQTAIGSPIPQGTGETNGRRAISAMRGDLANLDNVYPVEETSEDPLSHSQILSSIRAAKRLHLPTGEVLRAVRRQIDQD